MSKKLLVISGKLKHGKDTFTKYIIDQCYIEGGHDEIKSTAFSDPIKKVARIMFPQINDKDLWGPSENRSKIVKDCIDPKTNLPLTVRNVLTFIGGYGRACNENCWINCTFKHINKIRYNEENKVIHYDFIISDGRFLNELEFSKSKGAKIIRVIRPDIKSTSKDESETDLDNVPLDYYDDVIYNTSLDKLKEDAKRIANMYILR